MNTSSLDNGNCSEMNLRLNSQNHCSYPNATIISRSSCFLKKVLCGTCESASSNDINITASCMNLGGPTSVVDVNKQMPGMRIFPNPAQGQVTIDLYGFQTEKDVVLKVINALGMTLVQQVLMPENQQLIDLKGLSSGFYTVIVMQDNIMAQPQTMIVE